MVRQGTATVLTEHGYRVAAVSDGAEAISLLTTRRAEVAAVLTDAVMPVVDGVALCRVLQKLAPALPVVVFTGHVEEGLAQKLRSLAVREILAKPFSSKALLTAIHHALWVA